MENFWSLPKRGLHGTYISVEPFHLFRDIEEPSFQYNNRNMTDPEPFCSAMSQIADRRATCKELGKGGDLMVDEQVTTEEVGTREAARPSNAEQLEARPEFERFKNIMLRLLAVPKSKLDHKVRQAKKRSPGTGNPNAPGGKRKRDGQAN